jgi:hypothetical protein
VLVGVVLFKNHVLIFFELGYCSSKVETTFLESPDSKVEYLRKPKL